MVQSDASALAVELAEKASLPTTQTLMALGAMPATHPLSLGMLGMHAARFTNLALEECDLLLAVGAAYSLDLTALLRAQGFRVIRRVVYAATEAPALPESAARAVREREVSHAMFFSPRSAACSVALLSGAGLGASLGGIEALAISPRVALALEAMAWRRIRVASRPDQDHLLELLGTP